MVVDGRIRRNRQGKRSLTHTRTRRQNNQVGILETVREFVEFRYSRTNTRNAILTIIQAFQERSYETLDRLERILDLVVSDSENVTFGALQHLARLRSGIHSVLDNRGRRLDQLAESRLLAQQLDMPFRIRRRRNRFHEFKQVFAATHECKLVHGLEFRGQSHQVNRSHITVERTEGCPYQLVLFQIKKAFVLDGHDGTPHHVRIAQNTTEQATFRLKVHRDLTAFKIVLLVFKIRHRRHPS